MPVDAIKHCRDCPFGFMVDLPPDAGAPRRTHYFDACNAQDLELWVGILQGVAQSLASAEERGVSSGGSSAPAMSSMASAASAPSSTSAPCAAAPAPSAPSSTTESSLSAAAPTGTGTPPTASVGRDCEPRWQASQALSVRVDCKLKSLMLFDKKKGNTLANMDYEGDMRKLSGFIEGEWVSVKTNYDEATRPFSSDNVWIVVPLKVTNTTFVADTVAAADAAYSNEPGCIQYHVYEMKGDDRGDRLLLVEVYKDKAAQQEHIVSPHFLDWRGKRNGKTEQIADVMPFSAEDIEPIYRMQTYAGRIVSEKNTPRMAFQSERRHWPEFVQRQANLSDSDGEIDSASTSGVSVCPDSVLPPPCIKVAGCP
eukprot:CAMPEP_0117580002 /NCGR_PEP_ID=MMETSP0784-20121206/64945_1 /TAXON_ID=39447 /ORGANISM="" /LENGTH=367 /DNA_ID=CAMNT_0005379985 /DNA_START=215 /DNA_END=1318 /DNA_ORIENTATION=+